MSLRRESDFAHLKHLLQEADEQAEQEQKRTDKKQRRAKDKQRNRKEANERAELERQRIEDERRRAEEAESCAYIKESKTRRTTFKKYIRTCYTLLLKPLRV
jgi:hypothetical protein